MKACIRRSVLFALANAALLCPRAALAADSSAVDRGFASNLQGASSASSSRLWALNDGGAVVMFESHPSLGGFYSYYYHADPTGQAKLVWSSSYYIGLSTPDQYVATVLGDGSLVMSTPPFRRDALGAEITSFSPPSDIETFSAVTPQPDGKLLVAEGARLVRLLPDGAADTSFTAATAPLTAIYGIYLDGTGRIILSGTAGNARRVIRLLKTGAADRSFAPLAEPGIIGVTAEGAVITCNFGINPATGTYDYTYARYRADGTPDPDWNIQPWARTTPATAAVVAPSGEIYLARTGLGVFRISANPTTQVAPTLISPLAANVRILRLTLAPDGKLFVLGDFKSWEGFATSNLVRLDPSRVASPAAPAIVAINRPSVLRSGASVTVEGVVEGAGPLSYTWTALNGCPLPADTHSPLLVFDSFQRINLGRYQLQVSGPGGTATATVDLQPNVAPRLLNVSSRAAVGSGQDMLIAGIALEAPAQSTREYRLVLRGAGPALARFNVANPVPNPMITLRDATGAMIDRNDDWADSSYTRNWTNLAGAFPFAAGSRDALLVVDTHGGNYTLTFQDANGTDGTGLIEAYDVDKGDPLTSDLRPGALINLSLRGRVATASDPLLAGFVITDPAGFERPMKALARAVGPTLATFGVTSPLANPRLTVFDAAGRVVATNDDWSSATDSAETAAATGRAGAFPLPASSKDAALAIDLPAGSYTVHAASADAAAGIALIEIYRVP